LSANRAGAERKAGQKHQREPNRLFHGLPLPDGAVTTVNCCASDDRSAQSYTPFASKSRNPLQVFVAREAYRRQMRFEFWAAFSLTKCEVYFNQC
jgi:hypothetical protein